MMSRSGIFRVTQGVAVDMCNRVFKLPSLHGIIKFLAHQQIKGLL